MPQAPDEKELLWGSRPPLLPPAIGDLLFKHIEEGDSAELEEGDSAEIEEGDSSDWGSEETEDRRGDTPQRERHPNNSALSCVETKRSLVVMDQGLGFRV